MAGLSELSKTLYIPLVGRIHASRHYPSLISDSKVLDLEPFLPPEASALRDGAGEYAMVASVVRSINMDRRIREFLAAHPDAAVVSVGCGLETTYWRCDNGRATGASRSPCAPFLTSNATTSLFQRRPTRRASMGPYASSSVAEVSAAAARACSCRRFSHASRSLKRASLPSSVGL